MISNANSNNEDDDHRRIIKNPNPLSQVDYTNPAELQTGGQDIFNHRVVNLASSSITSQLNGLDNEPTSYKKQSILLIKSLEPSNERRNGSNRQ